MSPRPPSRPVAVKTRRPDPTQELDRLIAALQTVQRGQGRPRKPLAALLRAYLRLPRRIRRRICARVALPELAWLEILQIEAGPSPPEPCVRAVLALRMARALWAQGGRGARRHALAGLLQHAPLLRHIPSAWDLWAVLTAPAKPSPRPPSPAP